MTKEGKAVGLLVIAKGNSGNNAYLQRRKAGDTWAGGHQVSVHGGLGDGEDFIQALLREAKEEVSEEFAALLTGHIDSLVQLSDSTNGKLRTKTYLLAVEWPNELLTSLRKGLGEHITVISRQDLLGIRHLRDFDRANEIRLPTIAMFPDDLDALKKGFESVG